MPLGFRNENAYDDLLRAEGERVGVPWLFLKALVAKESGFDPHAYRAEPSHNDASYGLMQVLFATAQSLGYTGLPAGLYDPAINTYYGAEWAGRQWRRYGGDPASAAAAYNAGTAYKNAAGLYTTRGGNPIVQSYVARVLDYYTRLQADAGASPGDPTINDVGGEGPSDPFPPSNATPGLLRDAEGEFPGVWDSLSAAFSGSPTGSGWGWVPLVALGILGAWVIYEATT